LLRKSEISPLRKIVLSFGCGRATFSLTEKSFRLSQKSDNSAIRKIALSARRGRATFPLSEKSLFQATTEKRLFHFL
jgi:hypothetical protein